MSSSRDSHFLAAALRRLYCRAAVASGFFHSWDELRFPHQRLPLFLWILGRAFFGILRRSRRSTPEGQCCYPRFFRPQSPCRCAASTFAAPQCFGLPFSWSPPSQPFAECFPLRWVSFGSISFRSQGGWCIAIRFFSCRPPSMCIGDMASCILRTPEAPSRRTCLSICPARWSCLSGYIIKKWTSMIK